MRRENLEVDFHKWQNTDYGATCDNILIFVKVAQFESISRAARLVGDADLDGESACYQCLESSSACRY